MENLTLIQSEKIDSIQNQLQEIILLITKGHKEKLNSEWLPKPEARKRLHVCQKTLDNYLAKGILPYSRFAGKIYIKALDIQAHLEKHYINS